MNVNLVYQQTGYSFQISQFTPLSFIYEVANKVFHIEKKAKGVWVYSATFPNQAFMGWPVMAATLGSESLFFATFARGEAGIQPDLHRPVLRADSALSLHAKEHGRGPAAGRRL